MGTKQKNIMCLRKASKVKVATKDIVCYKNFYEGPSGGLITPYLGSRWIKNKTKEVKRFTYDPFCHEIRVNVGLHAFIHKSTARRACGEGGGTTFKMIVPKGTKYHLGRFMGAGIAALKMRFAKKTE